MSYEVWGDGGEEQYYNDRQVQEIVEEETVEMKAMLIECREQLRHFERANPEFPSNEYREFMTQLDITIGDINTD